MVVQLHFWGGQTEKSSANDFWHGKHVKLSVGKQQFFSVSLLLLQYFSLYIFQSKPFVAFSVRRKKKSFHFSFGDGKELLWFPIKKSRGL